MFYLVKVVSMEKTSHLNICHCTYLPSSTYKEFALVDVFAPAIGVLDLLAEDKRHLKKEEVALSSLTDQSLWIPNLKRLLQDELALGFDIFIKTWENKGEVSMEILPDILYVSTDISLKLQQKLHDHYHQKPVVRHLPAWRGAWHRWLSSEH